MANATQLKTSATKVAVAPVLPPIGLSKWAQIEPFIPMCRESWRKLVLAGRAPEAIRLTSACTVYKNEEIHRYLADPLNYTQNAA